MQAASTSPPSRLAAWITLALALALVALPLVLTPYTFDLVVKIAIYAVFALSLELLVGMTGLVSLGHAAFFGIGAYATVLATGSGGAGSLVSLLPLAIGAAALYALFVGALSLRTKGVYFIMVTLAFAQMAYFVFHDTKLGGGSDGIFLYTKPSLEIGAHKWLDLNDRQHQYNAVLAALVFSYALLGPLAAHWQLTLGLTIIVFVALLPRGLIGLAALLRRPRRAAPLLEANDG